MINYIITSSLLVIPAWLLYVCLVRNRTTLQRQKIYLYVMLTGSLVFPLVFPMGESTFLAPHPQVEAMGFGTRIDHHALQQYCRCEQPNYAHRIRYRANIWYHFLFKNKSWLSLGILMAMSSVLMMLIVQLFYLKGLIKQSRQESIEIDGDVCVLLYPKQAHSVAAFWLGKSYIVWQAQLEDLSEEERLAVYRHELSHLHQFNTVEKAAFRFLQCLWGLNPVFYLIRKELNLLSEYLADESGTLALPRKQYAHLLLHLQSLKSVPFAAHFGHSDLRKRIEHLLQPPAPTRFPYWQVAIGAIFALQLICVFPLSAEVSQTLKELSTYEVIYHKVDPDTKEAVYCTDCETVCTPDL